MHKSKGAGRMFISLLMPNRCPFCDRIIHWREYWCSSCCENLPMNEEESFPPEDVDRIKSVCLYSGSVVKAMHRMKDGSYIYAIDAFSRLMSEYGTDYIAGADIITGIPVSLLRRVSLGYSHAEWIAKRIAAESSVPYKPLLGARRQKTEQKKLGKNRRRYNAQVSFYIRNPEAVKGRTVLLVDDITTTGATLSAAAKLLKDAGAKAVYAYTFAKTPDRRQR